MAKHSKAQSKTLITQLVIVGLILAAVAVFVKSNLENRSKAAYNPTQQCLKTCDGKFIKNQAACKLDCPKVIAETMTCNDFCSENVRNVISKGNTKCTNSGTNSGKTQQPSCPTTPGGRTTTGECKKSCALWTTDPCSSTEGKGMCKNVGTFTTSCSNACNSVKADTKTCDEAFTADAFNGMNQYQLMQLNGTCKFWFE